MNQTRLARRYNMVTVHMFVLFDSVERNLTAYLEVNNTLMMPVADLLLPNSRTSSVGLPAGFNTPFPYFPFDELRFHQILIPG